MDFEISGQKAVEEFKMTVEGYAAAKEFLLTIGKYDEFMSNKTSVDGYSLVYYANSLRTNYKTN